MSTTYYSRAVEAHTCAPKFIDWTQMNTRTVGGEKNYKDTRNKNDPLLSSLDEKWHSESSESGQYVISRLNPL